jgi:hypothetical protein
METQVKTYKNLRNKTIVNVGDLFRFRNTKVDYLVVVTKIFKPFSSRWGVEVKFVNNDNGYTTFWAAKFSSRWYKVS